jgi:hypothetical protein
LYKEHTTAGVRGEVKVNTFSFRFRVAHAIAGFTLAVTLTLLWAEVALASTSGGNQYGAPTGGGGGGALAVLPSTGGPLLLVAIAGLALIFTGLALLRLRASRR